MFHRFAFAPTLSRAALSCALLGALSALPVAHAGQSPGGWTRSSQVPDVVTNNGNGTWSYGYTVRNTSLFSQSGTETNSPIIVDWELPWFGDAGITNIVSPFNWAYEIETIGVANFNTGWEGVAAWQTPGDPFYVAGSPFNNVTQVLHWYNVCWAQRRAVANSLQVTVASSCEGQFDNAVFVEGELDGFGFTAEYDATAAPYQASWAFLPVRTGDPAFPLGGIPDSPLTRGNSIDEPAPLLLLALAAGAAALLRRRSR